MTRPTGTHRPGLRVSAALLAAASAALAAADPAGVTTPELSLRTDAAGQRALALTARRLKTSWLASPSALYRLQPAGKVSGRLRVDALANGQIRLRLALTNPCDRTVAVAVTFPVLEGLSAGDPPEDLYYCFPKSGAVFSARPVELRRHYGGLFPMQFIDVYHPGRGGVYLMTQDLANHRKIYRLKKTAGGTVEMGVEYPRVVLGPAETRELPQAVLGAHEGDWHAAFDAYRRWLGTWYRPASPAKAWFREVFNFRQVFLHPNLGVRTGAFDAKTKTYRLADAVRADAAAFGGVDFVHVFDWSQTPTHGRVGQYDPWAYLGGADVFRRQIDALGALGIPVGAYLEGYLLSKRSPAAKASGPAWQMLAADGKPYARFGTGYRYVCPHVLAWRKHLADACARLCRQSGVRGVYMDEFGFGYQYVCHRADHGHPVPSNPLRGEFGLLKAVRDALPAGTALYTEETGPDVTTQLLDGSFTYAIASAERASNPSRVNLTRFALPGLKLFEIIRCDRPLGNDLDAVRSIFFNGEGIWLAGPLSVRKWFPPEVRRLIARTHRILREHREAFTNVDVTPLVPTKHRNLFANRFRAKDKVVWTLYNASDRALDGDLIEVAHAGAREYRDAWNRRRVRYRLSGNRAVLRLDLAPRSTGCIVQRKTAPPGR